MCHLIKCATYICFGETPHTPLIQLLADKAFLKQWLIGRTIRTIFSENGLLQIFISTLCLICEDQSVLIKKCEVSKKNLFKVLAIMLAQLHEIITLLFKGVTRNDPSVIFQILFTKMKFQ